MRRRTNHKTKLAAVLVVALGALGAVPSLAAAQDVDPTCEQYESTGTQIEGGDGTQIGGGSGSSDGSDAACAETLTVTSSGSAGDPGTGTGDGSALSGRVGPLPFTGFDVIAMAAVALAVAGLGLALQRAVSREPSDEIT